MGEIYLRLQSVYFFAKSALWYLYREKLSIKSPVGCHFPTGLFMLGCA